MSLILKGFALRLLVLVAGRLYWGLQVMSSFSMPGCVLKGHFERGVFWRPKSCLKGIEGFNVEHLTGRQQETPIAESAKRHTNNPAAGFPLLLRRSSCPRPPGEGCIPSIQSVLYLLTWPPTLRPRTLLRILAGSRSSSSQGSWFLV